jgi:hypothetical protein
VLQITGKKVRLFVVQSLAALPGENDRDQQHCGEVMPQKTYSFGDYLVRS